MEKFETKDALVKYGDFGGQQVRGSWYIYESQRSDNLPERPAKETDLLRRALLGPEQTSKTVLQKYSRKGGPNSIRSDYRIIYALGHCQKQ